MDNRNLIKSLIRSFAPNKLTNLMRRIAPAFRPNATSLTGFIKDDWPFDEARQLGIIELPDAQTVLVAAVHVEKELTSRSGKKIQYELGKRILKAGNHNAGIFAFYDDAGRFRLSLITVTYSGTSRQFSTFRRYTFFVDPELPNKTFINQIGRADFSRREKILEAFSLEAVSDDFYREFRPKFDAIAASVKGTKDANLQQDFALLFAIRVIFLGFVQKKGWLGGSQRFLQDFWQEYKTSHQQANTFYRAWLEPLFFEALNSPPGHLVSYGSAPFSIETQKALQMAPYLNGELFKRKRGVDDQLLWIPDDLIGDFFDFLFQYNFTVEENELYDEELELNPEFLGIIFERITNMDQGAVYTPRVEVDLMCRLSLVQWLDQTTNLEKRDLYHLFFREAGTGQAYDEYQKQGDFSSAEIRLLIKKLESVTVCDPAAGSGAFEVGMLQVLEQMLENLYSRNNTPRELKDNPPTPFERKKTIIANSLYGVEVKRWAVWINHLRLWLTLFVDMPDDFQRSFEPLLPNLTFKVRTGDSLVQRIAGKTFPVQGHVNLPKNVKSRITELKKKKRDFFYNRSSDYKPIEHEELAVFRAILDAEIEDRKKAINKLKTPKEDNLFGLEPTPKEQEEERKVQQQIAALEAEIADLRAQKLSLKDERPFIWSIEFAEIFFDRGGFDIIIGNPPYVRQENITDPIGRLSPKAYKDALLEMVRLDFPDYFAKSRAHTDQFKKGRKPSGRSDLYTYFYIRSLRLLNSQGAHVFICSNSWLDVGYGAWLQEFFLRQAPLHFIIDNHAKRSFARADVNTIISVASAPRRVTSDHLVRFVAFKQPFEDAVLSDNLLAITGATNIFRTETFRVYPITATELLIEGSDDDKYVGDKWGGKYLRAPDIFFTIMDKGKEQLRHLSEYFEGERYLNTGGADGFFIITNFSKTGDKYSIVNEKGSRTIFIGEVEEKYLKPIIKDAVKKTKIIEIKHADALCFVVMENPSNLAQRYIRWGEENGFHQRSVTRLQTPWYKPTRQMLHAAEVLLPRSFNNVFAVHYNPKRFLSLRFYRLHTKKGRAKDLVAFLNSTLFWLVFETLGNKNLGQGVLDFFMESFLRMKLPIILAPEFQNPFSKICCRPIGTIFTECGIDPKSEVPISEQEPNPLPDRKALDDIVFDALGLTEEERKEVYRSVCQLVWDRISKARSV